jgi:hypothetical protein
MAKKAMVIAPTRPLAILAAEKAGFTPHEFVWIGEVSQLMGVDGGKYVEAVSYRPFEILDSPERREQYREVLEEARMRWARVHGSTWTQVYFQ